MKLMFTCAMMCLFAIAVLSPAAGKDKPQRAPVSNSAETLARVTAYAQAMIEKGRDTYGPEKSPLFAVALDRRAMSLITREKAGNMPGIRNGDRALGGANPYHDEKLYHILYKLTGITRDPHWAAEADAALKYFFEHCQSPQTGLMAWGEHLHWDFTKEAMGGGDTQEMNGEWSLWDASWRLAPQACHAFALGLWRHQIADQKTGDFSRHAKWSAHGPSRGYDFPRYAGQMIATWADAYRRTSDKELLDATRVVLTRYQKSRDPESKLVPSASKHPTRCWPASMLELARCLYKSAPAMPEPLQTEMSDFALESVRVYCALPHDPAGKGIIGVVDTHTREIVYGFNNNPAFSAPWVTGYGAPMTAGAANHCYEVYCDLGGKDSEAARPLRELVLQAAGRYMKEDPEIKKTTLFPGALGSVIELLLNAHELTGDRQYLERAGHFAQLSASLFLDDASPLPKASNRHAHYEAITGGPDLMWALLRLSGVTVK